MSIESDALKARLKKQSALAVKTKMDLHDLSEELPVGWEKTLEVAQAAYDAHRLLADLKSEVGRTEA